MSSRENPRSNHRAKKEFFVRPKAFVFFDKTTRAQRFEVKADVDGNLPADAAASLLAVCCVARGQMPTDFEVMVKFGEDLLDGLGQRATRLIDACVAVRSPFRLTRRQHEVLRGVLQNLGNKEIAVQLNLAARTVKFHVHALFVRFDVADRMSLIRKTGDMLSAGALFANVTPFPPAAAKEPMIAPMPRTSRESRRPLNALERRSQG
jgi:DNA-binding NarL/FixJ family response regulator